jgi:hypothetical protein
VKCSLAIGAVPRNVLHMKLTGIAQLRIQLPQFKHRIDAVVIILQLVRSELSTAAISLLPIQLPTSISSIY